MQYNVIITVIATVIALLFAAYVLYNELVRKKKKAEPEQNEYMTMTALKQLYYSIYYVDLLKGQFKVISQPEFMDSLANENTSIEEAVNTWSSIVVAEQSKKEAREFFDLATIQERLRLVNSISVDLCMSFTGWECETIVAIKRNKKGLVTRLLILSQEINGPKEAELLQSESLREKSLLAMSDSRMKSEFLSSISHDLRTPMNAIMGFAQISQNNIDNPEKMRDCIDKILISCKHLNGLLNDVLEMSSLTSGAITLHESRNRISDIMQGLLPILNSQAKENKTHLSVDTSSLDNDYVYVDEVKLRRIIVNILGSSLKYVSEDGTVSIVVSQYTTTESGTAGYLFRIKDNGTGVSQDFISRVYSADEEPSEVYDTSLAYTKKIIDAMGGTINIESIKGKGTTFTVDLRLRLQEFLVDEDKGFSSVSKNLCKGRRVLVVEDNELNKEMTIELLRQAGFETDSASNGLEAIDKLVTCPVNHFDVVLMDITMPVMDGYKATMNIRRLSRKDLAEIPIIAMTANTSEDDKLHALASGMNDHLSKPVDIKNLRAVILNQL